MADSINEIANWGWTGDEYEGRAVRQLVTPIYLTLYNQTLTSAGLVIKGAGNTLAKAGSAFYATVAGKVVTKTANTDMAALSGTVTNAKFNVFVFYIDSAGTLTSAMGTEGATLAAVKFPVTPDRKAAIGFVIINPTGTGNFVGGTTALDDATVAPGALYVNLTDAFNPNSFAQLMAGN